VGHEGDRVPSDPANPPRQEGGTGDPIHVVIAVNENRFSLSNRVEDPFRGGSDPCQRIWGVEFGKQGPQERLRATRIRQIPLHQQCTEYLGKGERLLE